MFYLSFLDKIVIMSCLFLLFLAFIIFFSFIRSITLKKEIKNLQNELRQIKELLLNPKDLHVKDNKTEAQKEIFILNETTSKENEDVLHAEKTIYASIEDVVKKEPIKSQKEQSKDNKEISKDVNTQKIKNSENNILKKVFSWFFGGNTVAKTAIIILFFGLSFLLKYSIEHGLLSKEMRVLGSTILGFVLIALGFKLKKAKELYALLLQGGGIGVLYLTTFSAVKFYEMIPIPMAFFILVALCAVSVIFALSQNTLSLAIYSFLGAYIAPILLSDGSGNHKVLFTFYVLVSISILAISKFRSWRTLNILGFIFTFVVFYAWMFRSYHQSFYLEAQLFILVNLIIYGILSVVFFLRAEKIGKIYIFADILMLFGTPLLSFLAQYNIVKHLEFGAAFSAIFYGFVYLVGTFITFKFFKERTKQVLFFGIGLALCFATIAVPLALSDKLTALVWMLEGTIISFVFAKNKQPKISFIGLLLTIFGLLYVFHAGEITYLKDMDFLILYSTTSAILLFNSCLFYHFKELHVNFKTISYIFLIFSIIFWICLIFESANRFFDHKAYAILIMFIGAIWIWYFIGKKEKFFALKYAVISLWPLLAFVLFVIFNNIHYHNNIFSFYDFSWIFGILSAYFYLYIEKDAVEKIKNLKQILHVTLLWIVFGFLYIKLWLLISVDLTWGYFVLRDSITLVFASIFVLSIYCIVKKDIFPAKNMQKEYFIFGLAPVILCIMYKLLIGVQNSGIILGLKYIPILNPLEESALFGIIVLTFYFLILRKKYTYSLNTKNVNKISYIIPIFFVFIWANSILIRFLANTFDISWNQHYLWNSDIIQASISVFWTLIALCLIVFANKKMLRLVWFVGAILLGVVVVKLILVDSVKLEGLFRAFAFIGVALLMLLIGYLAPIPPKIIENTKEKK